MRAHRALSAAAAALIALLPLQAAAQEAAYDRDGNVSVTERPRPEYDALGKRLGGFDLHAAAELGADHIDNVFATDTLEQSDTVLRGVANAQLASHWSRHSLSAAAGITRLDYQDFSTDDATDWFTRGEGRIDLYRATELGGGLSFSEAHEPRTNPDSPLNSPEPVQFTRNEAFAYARHAFNRLRVTARASKTDYDFEDVGAVDQDYRDYEETVGTARVEIALSPRVAAVADLTVNEREYDFVANRDSNGRAYLVGVNFDVTRLVRGEVTVGQFDQDYDDPAIGQVDGFAYNANLQWFPTELTTVTFEAGQTVEESAVPGATFESRRLGARVDHELRRNVLLSAGMISRNREYTGIAREDDQLTFDVGATYLVNRRFRVRGGYVMDRNDGTGPGARDFDVNRVYAAVAIHL